jgi:protein TonB
MRLVLPFFVAVGISLGLFWLMQLLITPPEGELAARRIEEPVVVTKAPEPEDAQAAAQAQLSEAPPAPPSVPSVSLSMNASISLPAAQTQSVAFSVPKVKPGGGSLSNTGFGGFAGGAGSGNGYGQGKGFKGKRLVPLSTARPQIPQYAFEQGIEGWVEVVFFVNPNGRVSNIRIVDALPKGVFESAMIQSIQNWIYAQSDSTQEVKQRFEFKLDDFQYNWN